MSMRQIYRKIAKEHGVTVAEVKRDMQAALDDAYSDPMNKNTISLSKSSPSQGQNPNC